MEHNEFAELKQTSSYHAKQFNQKRDCCKTATDSLDGLGTGLLVTVYNKWREKR